MIFINRELRGWRWLVLVVLSAAAGCSGGQSPELRIQKAATISGMKGTPLFPIAGAATIDGAPPEFTEPKKRLIVMLYDLEKPELPMGSRPHVLVKPDGQFTFSEDGIGPGHYVLLFAVLRRKGQGNFIGPDELGNLYNDPELNAKNPEFVIDHQAPGKTDYQINLQVSGRPAITTPGPHAMTKAKY
jgi:hypothetical protein